MRKPLGLDFGKRRYWALGGRSACWRVYVEEAEGGSWGWYEGVQSLPGVAPVLFEFEANMEALSYCRAKSREGVGTRLDVCMQSLTALV